ncbi:MAG: DUF29 domain-containing protein [Thiohalocapsa sp.]|jgi:ribosomal protein L29|uniref:DUF29 domain-containing protein n=1 Tax=Thiohalocapsa sp. TaxID=2497641 RepID=UPI0025D5F2D2|nr:DUF29 domain-containing protein [Thiohalocapsa sp.]MCG6939730.1 DUF29 domain-containing protein [Thiohalocapsa sp.]
MQTDLYDEDLYAWAMTSARMVREGRLDELDREHLAEELESMGKSELRALESRLTVLLAHLLKWQFQPANRSKSWERTLIEQRKRIARLLRDSPSLKPKLPELFPDAYDSALRLAAEETGMDETDFPQACPYRVEEALSPGFYPATDTAP